MKEILKAIQVPTIGGKIKQALITAPHASKENIPLDDPETTELAESIFDLLKMNGIPAYKFIASITRRTFDQNRLLGLAKAKDMLPKMNEHLKKVKTLKGTFHMDVHSFTATDKNLPKGWCKGINVIIMRNDNIQLEFAKRFVYFLKINVKPVFTHLKHGEECVSLVEMPFLPRSTTSDQSNAVMEWCRHHGATSLLVEVPTLKRNDNTYIVPGGVHEVSNAIAKSIVESIIEQNERH